MQYIYLHGFASSPQSKKAQDLRDRFAQIGISLTIPDLNQGNFAGLTLSRQIRQVEALLPPQPEPVTLIGSSFGGLTAAWLGQRHAQIERLVLLAPAFEFLAHWTARMGPDQLHQWQEAGVLPVFHYGENALKPLEYGFLEDAAQFNERDLTRSLPTLILHGRDDDVIPLQASLEFARQRPWVRLIPLQSDHALVDVSDLIWQAINDFCDLGK